MTATYCVHGRWYFINDATLVADHLGFVAPHRFWSGWIWITEKKYHSDTTVTLFGVTTTGPTTPPLGSYHRSKDQRVVLEVRRNHTVKTLKDGPPVYIIQEQSL